MQQVLNQIGIQNALSVTDTAVSLTMPTGADPTHAIIQVSGANVRWRADGTAPTSTAGIVVTAGSNIEFMDPNFNYGSILDQIQFIRDDAGNATLEVAFFAC